MDQMASTFALPLLLFFVVTFLTTWWMRGRGFGELLGLDRPTNNPHGGRNATGRGGD
jgi:hypothetical protein